MRIIDFLKSAPKPKSTLGFMPDDDSLLNQITYGFSGDDDELVNFDVAIIGIVDGGNSLNNEGCGKGIDRIRPLLASLRRTSRSLKIIDLGDVKGNSLSDRYLAIQEVGKLLLRYQVKAIFVGGGQGYTLPVIRSLIDSGNEAIVSIVDAKLDLNNRHVDFCSQSFLSQVKLELADSIFDLNVLGVQKYLVGESQEQELSEEYWNIIRLRDLRNDDIICAEPILRDANVVSFDVGAIQQCYMPYFSGINTNGFTGYEACQMAWYAGMSGNLNFFGLYEYNPEVDLLNVGGALVGQIIWHLLEGIAVKVVDFPSEESISYKIFVVHLHNFNKDIRFYCNRVNHRWWIEVPWKNEMRLISCDKHEYKLAKQGNLPDKWWRFFQKSSKI